MKRYLLLFAVIGLVGCFLPLIGGTSITIFDLRHHALRPWLTLLAFGVPIYMALRHTTAATALAAIPCFGYLGWRFGAKSLDLVLYAGIGGKLVGVAIVGGVIATIGALLEERRQPAVG